MKVPPAFRAAIAAAIVFAMPAALRAEPVSYIVFEAETGTVIEEKDAFRPWYPASVTKLMTAYVTFRALRDGKITLQSPVVVSANALSEPPSKMGFAVGTRMTVDNALKMVLVKSANDIAVALGEGVSGTEEAFLADMNAHAKRLGMTRTHFKNPHGLPDNEHVSNARDMAILARALIVEFPEFRHLFKAPVIQFGKRKLKSANSLLERYPGAIGMKTGYICNSGYNMVASAERSGRTMVAVVFGAASGLDRAVAAAGLLDKAFARFVALPGGRKLATLVRPSDPGSLPEDGYCRRAQRPTAEALLLQRGSSLQDSAAYASLGTSTQTILREALNSKSKKGRKRKKQRLTGGMVLDALVGPRTFIEPVQVVLGAPVISAATGQAPIPAERPVVLAAAAANQGRPEGPLYQTGTLYQTRSLYETGTENPAGDADADAEIEPIDIPGPNEIKEMAALEAAAEEAVAREVGAEEVAIVEPWPKVIDGIALPQPRPDR